MLHLQRLFLFTVFCFSNITLLFAQGLQGSTTFSGTSKANQGTYTYSGQLSYKSYAPGMGDIRYQLSITDFKITSFTYKGTSASNLQEVSFPIQINRPALDLTFNLKYFKDTNIDTFTGKQMAQVQQGAGDYADLSASEIASLKGIFGIKNKQDFNTLNFEVYDISAKHSYFDELDEVKGLLNQKLNTEKKIEDLKRKISSTGSSKKNLLAKKSLYEQLASLDKTSDYADELKTVRKEMEQLAAEEIEEEQESEGSEQIANKSASLSVTSKEETEQKKDAYEKIKEEKKKEIEESKKRSETYSLLRNSALENIKNAQNSTNYQQKIEYLKRAKNLNAYLKKDERQYVNDQIRQTTTREVSSNLASVDWGYGDRHLLLMLNSGFNMVFGGYEGQFSGYIPLSANAEFTFPISENLLLEFHGQYEYNLFLKIGSAGNILRALGEEVEELPNNDGPKIDNTSDYQKYYYGFGLNFGKSREFTILALGRGTQYYYEETENDKVVEKIGSEDFIPTYGLGLVWNFYGKDKQELGRLMASYSINDKTFSFLNKENEFQDVSNINLRYEAGYGAFLFGIEANRFEDELVDLSYVSIGIKLGLKIGA